MQYSYDNLGQLIGVSGARQETYSYDANGNRLYAASPALPNGEAYYTIGPENRLLSDGTYRYEYDAEGNLIRKTRISDGQATEFTYDYRNRVTDIVVKDAQGNVVYRTHYVYDVFDRRIATEVDADGDGPQQPVRTWTFYDGDNPYIDLDDQGNVQHYYLYGPDIDQVLARLDPVTGVPDWYLTDYVGSVRAIVRDAGGYGNGLEVLDEITYDSFGNVLSETNPTSGDRFKFTGRELDAALSLYYYRARWYDPQAGRFLREDPLSFTAGDTNLYRYVFNSPVVYVDPTGLSWWDKVKSFGRGLWNGFTGFFHEAIFVPMDFVGTGIDIFLGTGYETRSYLGRAFEEKLRAGQLDDWRDMYESLFLNVVLGGIPDLYVSLEDAYWGNWEPLGEWLGSAGAGALVFWGSCKLLQKRLPSPANRPPKSARQGLTAAESWGNPATLEDHFRRHGADFGARTAEEYAQKASQFFQDAIHRGLPMKMDEFGVIRIYDPETNTFGAYNPDGTTKTFFKPDPAKHRYPTNLDYWNAQRGAPPWTP